MRFVFILSLACLLQAVPLKGETPAPLKLWPEGAPGALGSGDQDIPTLTAYLPDPEKATGTALVICPGGGYSMLAGHEGEGYAKWLAGRGIAGLVLKYRLGSSGYHHPAMFQDVTRAMRLARSKATEWKLDKKKIGVMGSSAGGHLASTVLTHFDAGKPGDPDPVEQESSRPDFGVLCYAVLTMGPLTDKGSHDNFLGKNPDASFEEEWSAEKQVKADTPPCFIWHTWEDNVVKVENALMFAAALREKKVHFELHIYEKGGHGMGLGDHHRWSSDLLAWFVDQHLIPKPSNP